MFVTFHKLVLWEVCPSTKVSDSRSVLDDKVGVFKDSTTPGGQIGAFEAQVEARMIPVTAGILVVLK